MAASLVVTLFTAGCYNGCVYTMLASTGSIHWCYSSVQQGGEVEPIKSSPVCDPSSGLVWVGSHDQHLYALDVEVIMHISLHTVIMILLQRKGVVHKVFAGGGSCFSSPCVLSHCPLVCIATLRGNICGVNSVSHLYYHTFIYFL